MTLTFWSVQGTAGADQYAIAAVWDKHDGFRVHVQRLNLGGSWWDRLTDLGPYADQAAAVRAARRQMARYRRDVRVTWREPSDPSRAKVPR